MISRNQKKKKKNSEKAAGQTRVLLSVSAHHRSIFLLYFHQPSLQRRLLRLEGAEGVCEDGGTEKWERATKISCRAGQENSQTSWKMEWKWTKGQSWETKSRELAFLLPKLEWKSLVYWISCSLHLISHTSITSQPEIVNRSHMEEQVGC